MTTATRIMLLQIDRTTGNDGRCRKRSIRRANWLRSPEGVSTVCALATFAGIVGFFLRAAH